MSVPIRCRFLDEGTPGLAAPAPCRHARPRPCRRPLPGLAAARARGLAAARSRGLAATRAHGLAAARSRDAYWIEIREGGQYVAITFPIRALFATVPQRRESHDPLRLSPIMK
jgi:hypothetical protein